MKLSELKKYKKILILGYGKEGQATEKFLKKYLPDATIGTADQKQNPDYLDEQKDYDLIIRSPGIKKELIIKQYTTATNIFLANIQNMVIGVTGTKGKSTTVGLIYSILKKAGKKVHLIGNIGYPMLESLLKPIGEKDMFVCEFSSYQLDDIKYSPHIAVVLDLFPEHMNYHGGIQRYYSAKKNIAAHLRKDDYFIYNPKFPELKAWIDRKKCIMIPFEQDIPIRDQEIPLIGEHNKDNIKAATTVAHHFDIDDTTIKNAIKEFKLLPHRLEMIGSFKGITFYDDAISTTPESTIFAIESLKNIGTIFLGGEDRGYDFRKLVKSISDYHIFNVVLFPDSGLKIYGLIGPELKKKLRILNTRSMEKAIKFGYAFTPKGSICLLSTASPSYSLWKDFEEKGDQFKFFVRKYQ